MKNLLVSLKYLLLIFILYMFSNINILGQYKDYGTKIGLQLNGLVGLTDFDEMSNFKPGYLGRAFLRFELGNAVETEIGGGYGFLQGLDFADDYYQTELIPVDLRFILRPFNSESINPYVYAGIGALKYSIKNLPQSQQPKEVKTEAWTGIVPVGLGLEVGVSESIILDLTGGVSYSFSDDLNYFTRGAKDAYATAGLGITFVTGSGSSDNDKDGLTKSQEKELGTDYDNPDTDGDGIKDGDEIYVYKTDPKSSDSDKDGLADGDELNSFKTDPNKKDTDNDGLEDKTEIIDLKTDANIADTDKDGLTDSEEVNNFKTNPLLADTDKDGLNDNDEIKKYETNPLKDDSDGDGLTDGDEVLKYKTNPLNIDTDGGTVSDNAEVKRGTNPNDANDDVVKVNAPMVLEGVTFASGKSDITPESAVILEQALKTLQTYEDIIVEIRGYTDNVGSKSSNVKLSQKRADSVRNWLVEKGINGSRIRSIGYGPENPIVPNTTQENKRKNRRIEFVRVK